MYKKIVLLMGIAMLMSWVCSAQSGGMNVGQLYAQQSVEVGSDPSVVLLGDMISLPPLSNLEILSLQNIEEGTILYSAEEQNLLFYNGSDWLTFAGVVVESLKSCSSEYTDIDGNVFHGVEIGNQCWMDRNLAVETYPNGDAIPYASSNEGWAALADTKTDDAFCYFNDDPEKKALYGNLYSYAAAIGNNWTKDNVDNQGICPDGWHLPNETEWTILMDWLSANGYNGTQGVALKSTSGWSDAGNGDDVFGFTALPGGWRQHFSGECSLEGTDGYWWSATESPYQTIHAWYHHIFSGGDNVPSDALNMSFGFSVRCIKTI